MSSVKSSVIIYYEGFIGSNGSFLPKEVAVIGTSINILGHWIINPEYSFSILPKNIQKYNNELTILRHGIEWYEGEASAKQVYSLLRSIGQKANNIYTYGHQQTKFTEELLSRKVINLKRYGITPLFTCDPSNVASCVLHGSRIHRSFICALRRVIQLRAGLALIGNKATSRSTSSEHTSDFGGSAVYTRSYSRRISSRQNTEGVDETDSNRSKHT